MSSSSSGSSRDGVDSNNRRDLESLARFAQLDVPTGAGLIPDYSSAYRIGHEEMDLVPTEPVHAPGKFSSRTKLQSVYLTLCSAAADDRPASDTHVRPHHH
jgi:hypothetical protein